MNNFWNELYAIGGGKTPQQVYATKGQCEKLALEQGATIEFNYYGKRKHKLVQSDGEILLCEGYDELLSDLELI